jgi:hypothetical protein
MYRVTRTDVKNMSLSGAAYVLENTLALIYYVSKHLCNYKWFRNVRNFKLLKHLLFYLTTSRVHLSIRLCHCYVPESYSRIMAEKGVENKVTKNPY